MQTMKTVVTERMKMVFDVLRCVRVNRGKIETSTPSGNIFDVP